MSEPTEVFIVTSGEYSAYAMHSVHLTLDEAKEAAGDWARVEVWPIGENRRTLGTFSRSCSIDFTTGEESASVAHDDADIADSVRAVVLYWPNDKRTYKNKLGIRVDADTQERCDKIFSELKARVRADISSGLPMELIADEKYAGDYRKPWVPTERFKGRLGDA